MMVAILRQLNRLHKRVEVARRSHHLGTTPDDQPATEGDPEYGIARWSKLVGRHELARSAFRTLAYSPRAFASAHPCGAGDRHRLADRPETLAIRQKQSRVRYGGAWTPATTPSRFRDLLGCWKLKIFGFHQGKVKVGVEGYEDAVSVGRLRRRQQTCEAP
jgi:hypothetical protein